MLDEFGFDELRLAYVELELSLCHLECIVQYRLPLSIENVSWRLLEWALQQTPINHQRILGKSFEEFLEPFLMELAFNRPHYRSGRHLHRSAAAAIFELHQTLTRICDILGIPEALAVASSVASLALGRELDLTTRPRHCDGIPDIVGLTTILRSVQEPSNAHILDPLPDEWKSVAVKLRSDSAFLETTANLDTQKLFAICSALFSFDSFDSVELREALEREFMREAWARMLRGGPNPLQQNAASVAAASPSRDSLPSAQIAVPKTKGRRTREKQLWEAEAMMIVQGNPEFSNNRIAQLVGRDPAQLSKSRIFRAAAALARGDKSKVHAGRKFPNEDGLCDVEAAIEPELPDLD